MDIRNGPQLYHVGDKVADNDKYRLYLCIQEETGRQCLLQVATAVEHNGNLERATYILRELKRRSDELEAEYESVKKDPEMMLNYDLAFPELVDSFIYHEQGGRRINILAFRNVEDVSNMVPLINITSKDHLRIDLRTSAWIMGKLLKLLVFAHSEGISIDLVSGSNILIEPKEHYVLIFDWSDAQIYPGKIPMHIRNEEIAQAAQAVVIALGGDLETGAFPDDGKEAFKQYTDHLRRLAYRSEMNAGKAHGKFYELIDSLWKREYYPFTTKSL